jgi:predicted GNAT family acetyltransferase
MTFEIQHDKDHTQFVAVIEGKTAMLKYFPLPEGKVLNYHHTFVPPELRGQHIGQDLVKYALDYAVSNGYKVVPQCPFVRAYIERHPEYKDLIHSS